MDKSKADPGWVWSQEVFKAAEDLVSPHVATREEALDSLMEGDISQKSPLIAYLITTRITDPDLEFRFHIIQAIGKILSPDKNGNLAEDGVITQVQSVIANMKKEQILDILAVADHYMTAETGLVEIFKLSSYAGSILSDIVIDQKVPVSIRQQAIYYCGEVGFLDTIHTLEGLRKRVEGRKLQDNESPKQKRAQAEDLLYPYAIAALDKLNS
jgi:hypothetical protein